MTRKWPDREQWAENRRINFYYYDSESYEAPHATRSLSAYATPDEVTAVITALEELRRGLGRAMKKAKLAAGPLGRQPRETTTNFVRRWLAMSDADQQVAHFPDGYRLDRRRIALALARLREGLVPDHARDGKGF